MPWLQTRFPKRATLQLGGRVTSLPWGMVFPHGGPPPIPIINTPGTIYKDMYIVGGVTNGPGAIRAFECFGSASQNKSGL